MSIPSSSEEVATGQEAAPTSGAPRPPAALVGQRAMMRASNFGITPPESSASRPVPRVATRAWVRIARCTATSSLAPACSVRGELLPVLLRVQLVRRFARRSRRGGFHKEIVEVCSSTSSRVRVRSRPDRSCGWCGVGSSRRKPESPPSWRSRTSVRLGHVLDRDDYLESSSFCLPARRSRTAPRADEETRDPLERTLRGRQPDPLRV